MEQVPPSVRRLLFNLIKCERPDTRSGIRYNVGSLTSGVPVGQIASCLSVSRVC